MLNVYRIGTILRLEYKKFFKTKQTMDWLDTEAILANSESEAIKKCKDKIPERVGGGYYKRDKYCTVTDIEFEIWDDHPFTINELKDRLNADDFMLYCKDRMGMDDIIEIISE